MKRVILHVPIANWHGSSYVHLGEVKTNGDHCYIRRRWVHSIEDVPDEAPPVKPDWRQLVEQRMEDVEQLLAALEAASPVPDPELARLDTAVIEAAMAYRNSTGCVTGANLLSACDARDAHFSQRKDKPCGKATSGT